VLAEIAARYERLEPLRLAVLGCSTGAELYSILYMLRLRRSDLELSAVGLDISEEVIAQAAKGEYGLQDREVERLSSVKREALCRQEGDHLYVHEWLRQGVQWIVADACDPNLSAIIGPQDIVVANNFLIHLSDELAERCLRSIISLVTPGGHLCVWGVNLDMRTRVVHERGLVPILSRIEEIHNADERAREVWPWLYWGLEPLDRARPDWQLRYVTIFQVQQSLKK
jgi:chemotaxis methyl-accepting protein methylase